MKNFLLKLKPFLANFFKTRSPIFYVFIGLFVASAVTTYVMEGGPKRREAAHYKEQVAIFEKYWAEEGAQKFRDVGLEPTEQIYEEELAEHLRNHPSGNAGLSPEERISKMKNEFRTWWETGGSKTYAVQNKEPTEELYNKELARYVRAYTSKEPLLRVRLNAADMEGSQLLLHWVLFPGIVTFILNLLATLFCVEKVEVRFGRAPAVAGFFAAIFLGALLVYLLGQTSFFALAASEDHYKGMYFGAAIFLGVACGCAQAAKDRLQTAICAIVFAVLLLAHWFTCPQIYVAAILVAIVLFALGIVLARVLPAKKKSKKELAAEEAAAKAAAPKVVEDPVEKRKKKTRAELDEGLSCAMRGDFALAAGHLNEGMRGLLAEATLDIEALDDITKKIVSPSLYVEIAGATWLEWGMGARNKGAYDSALLLFEKSLTAIKDAKLARKALYLVGEIRVLKNKNPEEGAKRLQKVLELGDGDVFATQARKLLERVKK